VNWRRRAGTESGGGPKLSVVSGYRKGTIARKPYNGCDAP
jgi:hypothetical protein